MQQELTLCYKLTLWHEIVILPGMSVRMSFCYKTNTKNTKEN